MIWHDRVVVVTGASSGIGWVTAKEFAARGAVVVAVARRESNLKRLALAWDAERMDILLMLADPRSATGHSGSTDFLVGPDGTLGRAHGDPSGLIYAGAAIADPAIFAGAPAGPLSLNRYFDEAIAKGRLFGMRMQGSWITVGTPDAIQPAEAAVQRALAVGIA